MAASRWFVDESALGLGKLLARLRDDVVYTGHLEVPDIPLGCLDVDWMPRVATRDWVVFRRDRRIHTRRSRCGCSRSPGCGRCGSAGRRTCRYWSAIEQARTELGNGPWSITLLGGGLAERVWRPE